MFMFENFEIRNSDSWFLEHPVFKLVKIIFTSLLGVNLIENDFISSF